MALSSAPAGKKKPAEKPKETAPAAASKAPAKTDSAPSAAPAAGTAAKPAPKISPKPVAKRDPPPNAPQISADAPKPPSEAATQAAFKSYAQRGDDARPLQGNDLLNEVGVAMNLPVNNEAPKEGDAFFSGEHLDTAKGVAATIDKARTELGAQTANLAVIPVVYENDKLGPVQLPLFRVDADAPADGSAPASRYVDTVGRVYKDFTDWETNNTLPAGKVTYPVNGDLTPGEDGLPDLKPTATPQTVDTFWEKAHVAGDYAALAGGLVIGTAAIIGTGGLAIPAVGAGLAAWGAYRTGSTLYDMAQHSENFATAKGLSAGAGFAASALGLGALGATGNSLRLMAAGQLTPTVARVTAGVSVAAQGAGTVAIADAGANLVTHWSEMTPLERATAASQIAFWGGGMRMAGKQAGGVKNLYSMRAIETQLMRRQAVGDLTRALDKSGFDTSDPAKVGRLLQLEDGLPDTAVKALRQQALNDPKLASDISSRIQKYSADALKMGADSAEGKLLRLQLLALSLPESSRGALMQAVRMDLSTQSDQVAGHLHDNPETKVKRLIIGGGPMGSTAAQQLHAKSDGTSTLVVDATPDGGGNFGSVRNHRTNSTGPESLLEGAPVQGMDLNPDEYLLAADLGDAASLSLYGANVKGTDVLTSTRVLNVEDSQLAGATWPGRYKVTLNRNGKDLQVYTDQVVDMTGLGAPRGPRDAASAKFVGDQRARLQREGGNALGTQSVAHSEDVLRAWNTAKNPEEFFSKSPGDIHIVGGGDAGKTPLVNLLEYAQKNNIPVEQIFGDKKVIWHGLKSVDDELWGPYAAIKPLIDKGIVRVAPPGGHLDQIADAGGGKVRLTFKDADGNLVTTDGGHTILAIGMQNSTAGDVFSSIVPKYDPKVNRAPLMGPNAATAGEGAVGARLVVPGGPQQDIFFGGLAAGQDRPKAVGDQRPLSYVEWATHMNKGLVEKYLATGAPEQSPFVAARAATEGPALSGTGPSSARSGYALSLDTPNNRPLLKDDTPLRLRSGMQAILGKHQVQGLRNLDVNFESDGGRLVMRCPQLDEASAQTLRQSLQSNMEFIKLVEASLQAGTPVRFRMQSDGSVRLR